MTEVSCEEQAVLAVHFMAHMQVKIIKGSTAIVVAAVGDGFQDPVRVSGPTSNQKGSFFIANRSVERKSGGEGTDSANSRKLFFVTVIGGDIQNRGKASAKFFRYAAF